MVFSLSVGVLIGAAVASYNKGYDTTQFIPLVGLIGVVASFEHSPDIQHGIGFSFLTIFICFTILMSIVTIQDNLVNEQIKLGMNIHDGATSDEEVEEQTEETENVIHDDELEIETLEETDNEEQLDEQLDEQLEETDENELTGVLAISKSIILSDSEETDDQTEEQTDDEMTGILPSPEETKKIEEIIQDKTYVDAIEKEKYADVATILTHSRDDLPKDIKLDDRKDYFDFSQNNIEQVNNPEKLLELIRVNPIISSQHAKCESLLPDSPVNELLEDELDEDSSKKMEEID